MKHFKYIILYRRYLFLGGFLIKILLFGEQKFCDFYNLFLSKNGIESFIFNKLPPNQTKGFDAGILFPKDDIHSTEDIIKGIREKFGTDFKLLPIIEKKNFYVLEIMFLAGVENICFEFKPETILSEIKSLVDSIPKKVDVIKDDEPIPTPNQSKTKDYYIINFYENKGVFIVDLSGELKKEKLTALRLMFNNYLINKLSKLKGIIYIFNNASEKSLNFQNIWSLFRIWKAIGIDYSKIIYLCNPQIINERMGKYVEPLGVKHYPNLLDITKYFFPELSAKSEIEIFEFASTLLQSDTKK